MAEHSHTPRRLRLGWYIAVVVVVILVMVVLGAGWKNNGPDLVGVDGELGGAILSLAFGAVAFGVLARRYSNPTLPVVGGALLGLGAAKIGESVGRPFGWWGEKVGSYGTFFLVYFLCVWLLRRLGKTAPSGG